MENTTQRIIERFASINTKGVVLVNKDVYIDDTKGFKLYINTLEDVSNDKLQRIYKHVWEAPFDKNGKMMIVVDEKGLLQTVDMDKASVNKMIILL
jgi:hypothetical protein